MIPAIRKKYNEEFSNEKYEAFLQELEGVYPGQLDFRVAETPLFIPKAFSEKMLAACDSIIDVIQSRKYKEESKRAIPNDLEVPGEDDHPHCIAFDFGICENEDGNLEPQLIEMQGFPSLFAWQVILPEVHKKHFWTPEHFSPYLNGFTKETYVRALKELIIGDADPSKVILLEINPLEQKTRVDFFATETLVGISVVNLTDLLLEGDKLFYMKDDKKIRIKRIYNRVIFDDLFQQSAEVQEKGKIFQQQLDVEWIPHPNWFYKISKFSLPFIDHPYVPNTRFLSDVKELPNDLQNYVVKPLFSFAGQGVIIDVTKEIIEGIDDPSNWILQKKVKYAAVIETPGEPAKAEIRLFYLWPKGNERPIAANNLSRLSKGKMVGVRYNQDKTWVGGSFCLFEE